MSALGYAEFLNAMGHTVRHVNGCYWFNVHPHVYMSFPFQQTINASDVDWPAVFEVDGWVARFPCLLSEGRSSYRIIADQKNYSLDTLTPKARNQTRRGLDSCTVRPVGFDELLFAGLHLNRETLERQGRTPLHGFEDYWRKYYHCAAKADGAEAWGAYIGSRLAAYLISFCMDGVANILIVRSSREFLKHYPNNALMYSYLDAQLRSGEVREVSIGLESIQGELNSLDHFKLGMGFRKEPIGQRIALRPALRRALKGPVLGMARFVLAQKIGGERIAKLGGLLRWYSEQSEISRR